MNLHGLGQIVILIGLIFLPCIMLGLLTRLTPIYRLAQRKRNVRLAVTWGSGILCLGMTFEWVMWMMAFILYLVAEFYFDTSVGLVPGITRANVGQYYVSASTELWLRQLIPLGLGQPCFNANVTVCQLADQVGKIGSLSSLSIALFGLALVPTLVNLFLIWRMTRPRSRLEKVA